MSVKFILFKKDISKIEPQKRLNYPFYYEACELSSLASKELQEYLEENTQNWKHNFGLTPSKTEIVVGKMFGVLVVRDQKNQIGYLCAFSGSLIDNYHPEIFVPGIKDSKEFNNKYKQAKNAVEKINLEILEIKDNNEYKDFLAKKETFLKNITRKTQDQKSKNKELKKLREKRRTEIKTLSKEDQTSILEDLKKESLEGKYILNQIKREQKSSLLKLDQKLSVYSDKLDGLKKRRISILRQIQIDELNQYQLLNQKLEQKGLHAVFDHPLFNKPPSGTGDCCAPKLLQYAFSQGLTPISLAEFWWGAPHKTQIRKHKHFYPACTSRCKPILGHMLSETEVMKNPLLEVTPYKDKIEILFEDDHLLIINKPANVLSVPGAVLKESVLSILKENNKIEDELFIIHRLDQETSGILVLGKSLNTQKLMQNKFRKREVSKTYFAILDGLISEDGHEGKITLPLRGDPHNRPYQRICFDHGKESLTSYKVIRTVENQTYIHLYPHTGRTHQLRVHMAHHMGLNRSIIGDSLYGIKGERLMLHAEKISFQHPITNEDISIQKSLSSSLNTN